jgi:hypothetical protein
MNIPRPIIRPVPLSIGLNWMPSPCFIDQVKMDGVFSLRAFNGCTLAGERMRDGVFWAFDVAAIGGDDCRRFAYKDRWEALREISRSFTGQMRLIPCVTAGEGLEAVLRDGGEGIVRKHLDGYWGVGQWKCKRVESFDVRVVDKLNNAVAIEYENQSAGRCPVYGAAFQAVRVGDVIEITAMKRTAAGKFREPIFLRVRNDKNER